ncbi:MAG: transcriptional repressor [Deltaproteobacteria bacterium]|nr:transcriptional repressor [Deltaproteobacteria bacterium]
MARNGLKSTAQRDTIMEAFFGSHEHVAIGDLHRMVLRKNPRIGYATVYRTLKMLTECGLAVERHFGDGQARYEPQRRGEHHDHLICRACGLIVEFENEEIERLQREVAAQHGFRVESHRHEMHGLCPRCQKAPPRRR